MRKQMGPCFLLTITTLVAAMPQMGSDNKATTGPVPEISESNLDDLIKDTFSANIDSNSNTPPTDTNSGGDSTPPIDNGANSEGCECVPFYLCDDNNTIIEDGHGLLDIRIKDEVCNTYDQKCCYRPNIRQPTNPVEVFTPAPPPPDLETARNRCGIRNTNGVGVRITGAEDGEAQYGEFPWMVAVVQSDSSHSQDGKPVNVYQCGGSLIHPQVVLTGAHCVKGKENLIIRVGEWDTQTMNELYPTQDRPVREVVVHDQFNKDTLFNDVALLILENPVDLTFGSVGLICLPEENENMDGRDCVASGWGKDQFGKEGKYQVIMKKVDLPIVPREPCLDALRKTRLGKYFELHSSFICAGGIPGKDTCKGDGGGPLACPSKSDPGVYVQAGIVAWGIKCSTETPGVYANVPGFISWIKNQLGQRSIFLSGITNYNNSDNHSLPTGSKTSVNNLPTENHNNTGDNSLPNPSCECVPFYLCDDNSTSVEDGVALLDMSIKNEAVCGTNDQKCCRGNIRKPDNPVIATSKPKVSENRCGIRNQWKRWPVDENEAQYAEFPWMMAVMQLDARYSQDGKPVNVYQCGGSLIHPQVVLTGAHCVVGKKDIIIRAGEWDTQTDKELYPTQDRKVREVIIHEHFNNNSLINDPALLILENPVDMTNQNVGLICLPEENENMDGRDCVASGWGKDQFGKEGKYQVVLKRVDLPIIERQQCLEALHKTKLSTFFKLHSSFICAGGKPGKDTCKGDGGSPLACPSKEDPEVYVQAGIVAWGINCGSETPAVYVNVPVFVSWINNQLDQRNISLS